jgi:hypothetical protein
MMTIACLTIAVAGCCKCNSLWQEIEIKGTRCFFEKTSFNMEIQPVLHDLNFVLGINACKYKAGVK